MKRRALRPVAAFDIDGTLGRKQNLVMLMEAAFELGIFPARVNDEFRKLLRMQRDRKVTFGEYDGKLIQLYIDHVKGIHRQTMEEAARHVYDNNRDWLYSFTKELLTQLSATHQLITITGAMQETMQYLAPYWGFERHYASELELDVHGCNTGRDKSIPADYKDTTLLRHVAENPGLTLEGGVAIGDSRADIVMLKAVADGGGLPIAFNPKGELRRYAFANGWPVVLERADSIYVLHGSDPGEPYDDADAAKAVLHVLNLPRPTPRK
jgi:phosphoserine phosphatase